MEDPDGEIFRVVAAESEGEGVEDNIGKGDLIQNIGGQLHAIPEI